jgi:flagellar biosynthesis anti-sigma factor FlgM
MKVHDQNLASMTPAEASRTQDTARTGLTARSADSTTTLSDSSHDDIHLSELVRSLRSLAADSPERQARIEQIARAYASGNYKVDPQATASGMIDDALQRY